MQLINMEKHVENVLPKTATPDQLDKAVAYFRETFGKVLQKPGLPHQQLRAAQEATTALEAWVKANL